MAKQILSLFDIESYYCVGCVDLVKFQEAHCFNIVKRKDDLYNKKENCTSGIYHHDGKTNKYSIETNINYKAIYLSTYVQNSDLYLNWYYNGNISNNYYQTHHFGLNGNYTAQNKNDNMSKSGTKFIYETSDNNWAEFVNPVDVYWVAFE